MVQPVSITLTIALTTVERAAAVQSMQSILFHGKSSFGREELGRKAGYPGGDAVSCLLMIRRVMKSRILMKIFFSGEFGKSSEKQTGIHTGTGF